MKSFIRTILATFAALVLALGTVAVAQTYYGFNPSTGLEVTHGSLVSGGTLPALSGSGYVTADTIGGASTFEVTTNATTLSLTVTLPSAAPNGVYCTATDITTTADKPAQSSSSTTACAIGGTVASGDKVIVQITGF